MKSNLHLFSVLILLIFALSPLTTAKGLPLTGLDSNWQYYQTDDPKVDLSQLLPGDWKTANVPSIFLKDPSDGFYLWYKTTFDIPENLINNANEESLALYIESIRNSDETWLNDQKIGSIGEVSPPWDVWQEYPLNLPRVYPISHPLLKQNDNTLLIKINTGIGDISGTEYFGSVGITGKVSLIPESKAKEIQYKAHLKGNNIDVIIIILGAIDILLILFLFKGTLHNLPEFRWLILNSLLMILATLILDVFYLNDLKYPIFGFIRYITVFSIPIITALYFWSQDKLISKKIVMTCVVIQVAVALIVLLPWFSSFLKAIAWKTILILFISCFLYSLISALKNLKQKRVGSLAQLSGLLIYFFSIRTDIFNLELFGHRNVFIGALIFRYALLWAYFQRIRYMSACYKTLSERMLNTIEDKRTALARELHDGLGQHLAASKFQVQLAGVSKNKKHLDIIKEELGLAVNSMHRLIQGLHPISLDKHTLQEVIRAEAERFSKTYSITFKIELDDKKVSKATEIHLLRIFQEAVSNAVLHGKATEIDVSLTIFTSKLRFSIADNGIGMDHNDSNKNKEGGFGLISLTERLNLIGAKLRIEDKKNKGTTLIIDLIT